MPAGVCGIYQLHRLVEKGVDVTALEAGGGIHTATKDYELDVIIDAAGFDRS